MKIIIETSLKKIPLCCRKCDYYVSLYYDKELTNENDFICVALKNGRNIDMVNPFKERLEDCPLKEVE